uniref:NosD domain-containing protein n=1 Tax=Pontiella sp. TaxID=2837462 RepID=UPI0035644A2B
GERKYHGKALRPLQWMTLLAMLFLNAASFADNLSQAYEKAYFLETAKGQTEEALEIYRQIAATDATDENRTVITKTLKRMLEIYALAQPPVGVPAQMYIQGIDMVRLGQKLQAAALFREALDQVDQDDTAGKPELKEPLLKELLRIAVENRNEKDITHYQCRLISETDWAIADLFPAEYNNGIVHVPEGIFKGTKLHNKLENLTIEGELTIRGVNRDECILVRSKDGSLLRALNDAKATFDSLTLKSQIMDTEKGQGCGIWIENSAATVTNCAFIALGDNERSPYAVGVRGYSVARFIDCYFKGYGGAFGILDKAEVEIKNCVIQGSGMGIKINQTKKLTVENCFITGTRTPVFGSGSIINVQNNLLLNNEQGISHWMEEGEIKNNALINCGAGIDVEANGSLDSKRIFVHNNLVMGASGKTPSAQGDIAAISITGNIVFNEPGIPEAQRFGNAFPANNTYWAGSQTFSSNILAQSSNSFFEDPHFTDPQNGDFTPQNPEVLNAGHGLTDPAAIQALWEKYEEACK